MESRKASMPRRREIALIVWVNLILICVLISGFEFYLARIDPHRNLPFNGRTRDGQLVTWGYVVENNELGFREVDFETPKPAGTCRILVLGDSLTWGAGLAVSERYSNLLQDRLRDRFPERSIEVLNFAVPFGPTSLERDVLRDNKDIANPDQVVVGFCLNDTQPKEQDYSIERDRFYRTWGLPIVVASRSLNLVGYSRTSQQLMTSTNNFLERAGLIPSWEVALQRTYEPDSVEWQAFVQALIDIKTMSDNMHLPPPVFAVLNQQNTAPEYARFLLWYSQAQDAADEAGFTTLNYDEELSLHPYTSVNELDGHPSADVNAIYAEKLFRLLEQQIETGALCR